MAVLLGITINPVQSYIAESRKLMDLKNSSKIISDIMKEFRDKIGGELIYPNIDKDKAEEKEIDYSNTLIFEVDEIKTREEITNIKEEIFKNIGNLNLSEIFNCFWVFEEIKDNNYNATYKNLMRKFKSIKNTYEFEQKVEDEKAEGNHKCSLCGRRNTVEVEDKEKAHLNEDEDLCSFCLFKRNYEKENKDHIESVYDIAIKQWKINNEISLEIPSMFYNVNKIEKTIESVDKYKEDVTNLRLANKLNDVRQEFKYNKNNDFNISEALTLKCELIKVMDRVKALYDSKNEIKAPTYQYAFYQFDIDSLGKWMAGEFFENKEYLKEEQQKLSKLLISFAVKLKSKLKEKLNENVTVIYLGGDDFLGVMPIENIKKTWEIVDEVFKVEVVEKLENTKSIMTYSTSITIASCKDPMAYALNVTRKELEKVKERYNKISPKKNGVSVNYLVNSGKVEVAYFRKDEYIDFLAVLDIIRKLDEKISLTFIKIFQEEFKVFNFEDLSGDEYRSFIQIANIEFKRLVNRSLNGSPEKRKKSMEKLESLFTFFKNLLLNNKDEYRPDKINIDFENIKSILGMMTRFKEIEPKKVEGDKNE